MAASLVARRTGVEDGTSVSVIIVTLRTSSLTVSRHGEWPERQGKPWEVGCEKSGLLTSDKKGEGDTWPCLWHSVEEEGFTLCTFQRHVAEDSYSPHGRQEARERKGPATGCLSDCPRDLLFPAVSCSQNSTASWGPCLRHGSLWGFSTFSHSCGTSIRFLVNLAELFHWQRRDWV
jgi:hypothetical protein